MRFINTTGLDALRLLVVQEAGMTRIDLRPLGQLEALWASRSGLRQLVVGRKCMLSRLDVDHTALCSLSLAGMPNIRELKL